MLEAHNGVLWTWPMLRIAHCWARHAQSYLQALPNLDLYQCCAALLFTLLLLCRAHQPGECAASEVSLLCSDFLRLGYSNLIMDPGVRPARIRNASQKAHKDRALATLVTSWRDVLEAPIQENSTSASAARSQHVGIQSEQPTAC